MEIFLQLQTPNYQISLPTYGQNKRYDFFPMHYVLIKRFRIHDKTSYIPHFKQGS